MAASTRSVWRALTTAVVLAASVVAPVLARSASGATTRPGGKLVPASGALFGAYVDPNNAWDGNTTTEQEIAAFESQIGRKLRIDQHYYAWTDTFPTHLETNDVANGRIPLVSWEGTTLSKITSGASDAMIRARADGMKALDKQVFLRWAWEMNGNWYPWDGAHNSSSGTTNGPAKYRAAWKRIHDIFIARGATNVVWVWSVNNASVPNTTWNSWRNYYPGDTLVDWVAIDGYNWGTTASWSKWTNLSTLITPVYRDYATRKPIMISETSSVETGGIKGAWISAAGNSIKTSFPSVAAIVWFDVNKEHDWRADSSSRAMSAYRSLGADTYFRA